MTDIEVVIKAKDEFSKEFKKAEKAAEKFGDVAEEAAMKMGKAMEEAGISVDEMSDDFLELNPKLKLYKKLTEEAAKGTKKLDKAMDEVGESTKKADKFGKGFNKQLTGMVKGFIGIGTAIAAGRAIAKFAKDSFAAADAAGQLSPVFTQFEKASSRLEVAVGTQLGNTLEGTVGVLTRVKDSTAANLEITNRLIEAERKGIITTQELSILRTELNKGMRSNVDVVGELTEKEDELRESQEASLLVMKETAALNREVAEIRRARDIGPARPTIGGPEAVVGGEAFGIETGLLGQIGGAIDQLQLFDEGQKEVQDTYNLIVQGYDNGLLSLEATERELTKVAVQTARNSLAAGDFKNSYQAVAALAGELEISNAEALELFENMNTEAQGLPQGIEDAVEVVDELTKKLDRLDGTRIEVLIDVLASLTGGGTGTIGGGGGRGAGTFVGGGGTTITPKASGGGVTAGGSFLVGERGPELFLPGVSGNITPNNELGGGMASLEAKFDKLSSDIVNALLDVGTTISEALG